MTRPTQHPASNSEARKRHDAPTCLVCGNSVPVDASALAEHGTCDHPMDRGSYLRFDGMTWPNPSDPAEVQWRLRYGTPCYHDLLTAASFMHAYAHLIELPQRERNQRVGQIRADHLATADGGA